MRHEYVIGSNSFFISRYAPFQALEILGDLQQRFAAPLLDALGGSNAAAGAAGGTDPNPLLAAQQGVPADQQDAFGAMMRGFAKVSASLNGRELAALAKRLIDPERVSVSINGAEAQKLTPTMIEAAGMSPADVIALCVEIAKVNFSDFFTRFADPVGVGLDRLRRNPSVGSPIN